MKEPPTLFVAQQGGKPHETLSGFQDRVPCLGGRRKIGLRCIAAIDLGQIFGGNQLAAVIQPPRRSSYHNVSLMASCGMPVAVAPSADHREPEIPPISTKGGSDPRFKEVDGERIIDDATRFKVRDRPAIGASVVPCQ
jgi:hypothetical protein